MSKGDATQAREAVMLYQRKGDVNGALEFLQKHGWGRSESLDLLRRSDLTAARATAFLAVLLLGSGGAAWALWPDAWWLLISLLAVGVERSLRTIALLRRARAMKKGSR